MYPLDNLDHENLQIWAVILLNIVIKIGVRFHIISNTIYS